MNPEQLWETTLNKDARTLLQVKIGEVDEANEIFSRLMGDIVEPRACLHPGKRPVGGEPGRVICV
jgi:DNA gyrase/topoisomerase IV subunit B